MKKLLYLFVLFLPLWGCENNKPKEKEWTYIDYDTDLSGFKGKTVSQMFPTDNDQITIVFTDTTRLTIAATNSSLKLIR